MGGWSRTVHERVLLERARRGLPVSMVLAMLGDRYVDGLTKFREGDVLAWDKASITSDTRM